MQRGYGAGKSMAHTATMIEATNVVAANRLIGGTASGSSSAALEFIALPLKT
jgi:hypothetical protein